MLGIALRLVVVIIMSKVIIGPYRVFGIGLYSVMAILVLYGYHLGVFTKLVIVVLCLLLV